MNKEYISNSFQDTFNIGKDYVKDIKENNVLSLVGELGSGKTVFVKGVGAGLGINDIIVSPTYSFINEYTEGNIPLYHFDFYKVDDIYSLHDMGFEEYFYKGGIVAIEWGDKFPSILPSNTIQIEFSYLDINIRKIKFISK